jgi:hypothetical protein
MSSLIEIEAAVENLSAQEQRELLQWLESHVPPARESSSSGAEALKVFRELQREAALTPSTAKAWKTAVSDARR